MKFNILERQNVYRGFLRVDKAKLQFETFAGHMTSEIEREGVVRGDAVAAIVHHVDNKQLLFVKQFRYPIIDKAHPWPIEIVAGMLETGENSQDAMIREIHEEMGFDVEMIEPLGSLFASPGGSDERIYFFYCEVTDSNWTRAGGGVESEHEDIEVVAIATHDLAAFLDSNQTLDMKTYAAISWYLRKKH